jgi:hypothetical protein
MSCTMFEKVLQNRRDFPHVDRCSFICQRFEFFAVTASFFFNHSETILKVLKLHFTFIYIYNLAGFLFFGGKYLGSVSIAVVGHK